MEFVSLLNGKTTEEKIAGVILCERYLSDQNESVSSSLSPSTSQSSSFECLCSLLESVSDLFLVQMLQTKSQGEGISLQDVAISIFSYLSQHPSLIRRFSPFCSQIFDLALADVSVQFYAFL
jgi:hypothetical protein